MRRAGSVDGASGSRVDLEELVDQTGLAPDLIRELEEYRIVQPQQVEGQRLYDETDREIVKACGELFRFGVAGRNLRVLRTSADREAALDYRAGPLGDDPSPPQCFGRLERSEPDPASH